MQRMLSPAEAGPWEAGGAGVSVGPGRAPGEAGPGQAQARPGPGQARGNAKSVLPSFQTQLSHQTSNLVTIGVRVQYDHFATWLA